MLARGSGCAFVSEVCLARKTIGKQASLVGSTRKRGRFSKSDVVPTHRTAKLFVSDVASTSQDFQMRVRRRIDLRNEEQIP